MKKVLRIVLSFLCLVASPMFLQLKARAQTAPAVADLTQDWSDYENPFGPWTLREGTRALPSVANSPPMNIPYPQQVWAPSGKWGNCLPAWFKAAGVGQQNMQEDWQKGDVVVHTTDPGNGPNSGVANVLWTSPFDGFVSISGGVWNARNNGRANKWTLVVDGHPITTASISSNDGHDRDHLSLFSMGSAGAQVVKRIPVKKGSTISLQIMTTVQYGEFTGVRMIVTPIN